jgi:hypothetical protein
VEETAAQRRQPLTFSTLWLERSTTAKRQGRVEVHPRAQVAVASAVVQVGAVAEGNATKRSVDHTRAQGADSGGVAATATAAATDPGPVTEDPASDLWCGSVVEPAVPIVRGRFKACMR